MAGYTVTVLPIDQHTPTAQFAVAVSVIDQNGVGVANLVERNFTVRDITGDTQISIAELQSTPVQGYYRLQLRAETIARTGDHVFALVVTHPHPVGRVAGSSDTGGTMFKTHLG